jgi:hypothetical protein
MHTTIDIQNENAPGIITTTLYDLILAMQENANDPVDEALIVPTVTQWLRSGRITMQSDFSVQPAA